MNIKNILMSCVMIFGSLTLSGCYTQLTMFHPELENDDSEQFYSYSSAGPLRSVGMYAQDGAGQSLSMAYRMMYNRFNGFMGYGNRYNYYNPYGGYYSNSYTLGGHTMNIPYVDNKTPRTWTTDRDTNSSKTNLNVTRTSTNTNVSSIRSSSGGSSSSSSSSSKSSGGRRATRRN